MVNLKSAFFIVIMLLHKGLTHVRSQKKPRLHFGETLTFFFLAANCYMKTYFVCVCVNYD